jgi:hypothetical protein
VFRENCGGRSHATSSSFAGALGVLANHEVIMNASDDMIRLTRLAETQRFSGKAAPSQRTYEQISNFWDAIVIELDEVFDSAK